jgi:hypothetical protein
MLIPAKALDYGPSRSTVRVQLPSGKILSAIAATPINSPDVVVGYTGSELWVWASIPAPVLETSRVSRQRPSDKKAIAYPFIALALFDSGGVWKGKDNKNKRLLDLPDNTDIAIAGIVNLGKGKFIADWLDYGDEKIYRFEDALTAIDIDTANGFYPLYYGGGFHGWILDYNTPVPDTTTIENTFTEGFDRRINSSRIRTTGEGYDRTRETAATVSVSLSPTSFETYQDPGTPSFYSVTSSIASSASVSDSTAIDYPTIIASGIVGSPYLESRYTETRELSLEESGTGELTYEHRFQYAGNLPGLATSEDNRSPSGYDFSISYSFTYSDERTESTDTGDIEVEIAEGVTAIARYTNTYTLSDTETAIGANPSRFPLNPNNINFIVESNWTVEIASESIARDFRPAEFFRGVDGLAFFSEFKKEEIIGNDRSSSGIVEISYRGQLPSGLLDDLDRPDDAIANLWIPYSVRAYPAIGGFAETNPLFTARLSPTRNLSRPLERRYVHNVINFYPATFFYPSDFSNTETVVSEWPRGGNIGEVDGVYFVRDGEKIALSTDDSFFIPVGIESVSIPESLPATVSFPVNFLGGCAIGRSIGIVDGSIESFLAGGQPRSGAIIRRPKRQTEATTHTPTDWNVSPRTRSATVDEHSEIDPAWEAINGADCAFVRKEGNEIYLYTGFIEFAFTDTWLARTFNGQSIAQYFLRRSIAFCQLTLETKTRIRYFAFPLGATTGYVFSPGNCTNLIRAYLKSVGNRRVSLYRQKGEDYFALAEELTADGIKKKGELWVDRYRFTGNGFVRVKEEKGSISALNGGGNVIDADDSAISYRP